MKKIVKFLMDNFKIESLVAIILGVAIIVITAFVPTDKIAGFVLGGLLVASGAAGFIVTACEKD